MGSDSYKWITVMGLSRELRRSRPTDCSRRLAEAHVRDRRLPVLPLTGSFCRSSHPLLHWVEKPVLSCDGTSLLCRDEWSRAAASGTKFEGSTIPSVPYPPPVRIGPLAPLSRRQHRFESGRDASNLRY